MFLRSTVVAMVALAACEAPLDPTSTETSTFGTEVYIALCNRVASSANIDDVSGALTRSTCTDGEPPSAGAGPRLKAMHAERAGLIAGLDAAVDPDLASRLNELHINMLPLYDEGLIAAPLRSAATLFDTLSVAPTALQSLARLSHRQGYSPPTSGGLLRTFLSYPRLGDMLPALTGFVRDGGAGAQQWRELLLGLSYTARKPAAPGSTLSLLQDLLLREDPRLDDGRMQLVALRDRRGIVKPRLLGGLLPPPFVDRDGDGLADVGLDGWFLGADGASLDLPPPFPAASEPPQVTRDAEGRLLRGPGGGTVYRYIDVSRTLLGGVVREGGDLLARRPGLPLDLIAGASLLLGPPAKRVQADPGGAWEYLGFAVERSPLLDLTHAVGPLLGKPSVRRALLLLEKLIQSNESEVAAVAGLVHDILQWSDDKSLDHGALEPGSNLLDDLVELMAEIARRPKLLESLLTAVEDQRTRELGRFFAEFLRFKDYVTYNPDDLNGEPINASTSESPFTTLKTPVDRGQPSGKGNRSVFQRVLHLIHDSNGTRMCNKSGAQINVAMGTKWPMFGSYDACKLLDIPDMAVFLVQVLLGQAEMVFADKLMDTVGGAGMPADLFFQMKSGITGFKKHPTAAGMFRMMFAPHNDFVKGIFDPILTKDGVTFTSRHSGTIFSWEQPGFYTALTPLLEAFHSGGDEHYFAQLMSVLHLHWSEPGSNTTQSVSSAQPGFAYQSGAVRYEELVARILETGDALAKVGDLLRAASKIQVEGVNGKQILTDVMRELLVAGKGSTIVFRDGRTFAVKNDGQTKVTELAPVWLLIDAVRGIERSLDVNKQARQRFEAALRSVADSWLVVQEQNGQHRFANRRVPVLLAHVIRFLRERIEAHQQDPAWGPGLTHELKEALEHPLVAVGLRFLAAVDGSPELRGELERLMAHMVGSGNQPTMQDGTLVGAANLLQALSDDGLGEIARVLAPAFDPQQGMVQQMIRLVDRALGKDPTHALAGAMQGMAASGQGGAMVLDVVGDSIAHVNRTQAGGRGPLTVGDLQQVFGAVTGFLGDRTSGLERMLRMVAER